MSDNAATVNSLFLTRFEEPGFKEKFAGQAADFCKDHLREESFAEKVLTKKSVSRDELQFSVNHDTLVKLVWTEPRTRALSMSFRAQPNANYFTAPKFEVAFGTVGSDRYEQTEQELMAYPWPITEFIRKNIVNDIGTVQDITFLLHSESCTQNLQQAAQGLVFGASYADVAAFTAANVNAGVPEVGKVKSVDVLQNTSAAAGTASVTESLHYAVQKDDLIKLRKLFPGTGGVGTASPGPLRCELFLMSETDEGDLSAWTVNDVGNNIVGETAVNGWKYDKVVNTRYVRTIKTGVLRPGSIYAFTAEDFLGGFLVFNKLQFWAAKERNRFSFEGWEDTTMYFGNVAAVRKLELFAGSVETTSADNSALRARFLPLPEKEQGKLNNLVEQGVTVPNMSQF
jgi:hypothetical protein